MIKSSVSKQGELNRVSRISNETKAIWDKKNTMHYGFKLQLTTDADIIDALNNADNKQGLIKQALREYIANHKKDGE